MATEKNYMVLTGEMSIKAYTDKMKYGDLTGRQAEARTLGYWLRKLEGEAMDTHPEMNGAFTGLAEGVHGNNRRRLQVAFMAGVDNATDEELADMAAAA